MKVEVTLRFRGMQITFQFPASYIDGQTPSQTWRLTEYMWQEGNYSCDCNKSLFARQCGFDWPELECGDEIELLSMKRIDDETNS